MVWIAVGGRIAAVLGLSCRPSTRHWRAGSLHLHCLKGLWAMRIVLQLGHKKWAERSGPAIWAKMKKEMGCASADEGGGAAGI